MKIAYLVNTYPRASHSFIRREIQALERQGFALHRFAMRSDRGALIDPADLDEDARTEHVLAAGALRLGAVALAWMLARPWATGCALRLALVCGARGAGSGVGRLRHLIYLAEAAYIARRCQTLGITHLHAHFGTNSAAVAMLCHALDGPRYSFTVHGPEEFDAPAAQSLRDKINHAAFTVAISSYGRSQLCRWADHANWPRLKVVHCGIEPRHFDNVAPLPVGGPHLVAIGRLSEQKGFALLIEAVALAAPRHPDLHLTLVGEGALRGMIEARIAALAAANALILPSFAEGLPVVVMEAMAAGRPVIATVIAGLPELVTDQVGWLVPAGDGAALAQAIDALAAVPPARLAEMGSVARARVFARHDIDIEAAKLAALFNEAPA